MNDESGLTLGRHIAEHSPSMRMQHTRDIVAHSSGTVTWPPKLVAQLPAIVALAVITDGCSFQVEDEKPTPWRLCMPFATYSEYFELEAEAVPWASMVSIIQNAECAMITQTHSGEVYLYTADARAYYTAGAGIDAGYKLYRMARRPDLIVVGTE